MCSQHLGPCHSILFAIASWHWPQFMMITIMTHCSTRSDKKHLTETETLSAMTCQFLGTPWGVMASAQPQVDPPFEPKQDIPGFGVAHLVSFLSVCRVQGGWPDHGNGFCWLTRDVTRIAWNTKWALQIHQSQRRMPDNEVTEKDAGGCRNHEDSSKNCPVKALYAYCLFASFCHLLPISFHVLKIQCKVIFLCHWACSQYGRDGKKLSQKAFFAPPAASCCAACAAANLCILHCSNIVGRCGQWTACWGKDFRRFSAVSFAIMMLDVCRCSQFGMSRVNNKARCGNERALSLASLDLEFDATFYTYVNEFEHLGWDIELSAATPASQPRPDKESTRFRDGKARIPWEDRQKTM